MNVYVLSPLDSKIIANSDERLSCTDTYQN